MPETDQPPDHLREQQRSRAVQLGQWVLGATATAARYPFDRVPLYRRDRTGHDCDTPDLERDLPGDATTLQRAADGVGPLFHRRYWIDLADCEGSAADLLQLVAEDINAVAPATLSRFEDADGDDARSLRVGDEVVVRLPGPWDGPVRVIQRDETCFRLATMDGHIEAGEIRFAVDELDHGFVRFTIDSWARSGSRLFHHLYTTVPLAREVQLLMWAQVCRAVADLSGGVMMSNVQATTHQLDDGDGADGTGSDGEA